MKPEIVIVGPMYPPTQARLEELFAAHRVWEAANRDALLQPIRDHVRGIAVSALHGCPAALTEALPRVEIIACFGIGFDAIDLAAAKSCGIRVINIPNVVTDDTADIALSLILADERRIAEGDRFVRRGDWLKGELPFGRRLGGPSSASWAPPYRPRNRQTRRSLRHVDRLSWSALQARCFPSLLCRPRRPRAGATSSSCRVPAARPPSIW